MKKVRFFLLIVAIFATALLLARRVAPAAAVPPQQANLLTNPSFEEPYSSGAASGWGRWHMESADPGQCSGSYAFRPSWSREGNPQLVFDGSVSQHIGNQFDTWNAGVLQDVNVTAGTRYRFCFSAIGRASNDQFPAPSDGGVNLGVQAGIDPNGSGLWTDPDIVWGGAISPHDSGNQANWQQTCVEATASGGTITVLTRADLRGANNCRAHLDVWFDAASLTESGPPPTNTPPPQPTQPPPPPVTNTPVPPTATATPEVSPTPPTTPTATPTNTPTAVPTGTVCVNAFADENANGQQDEGEGAMAGVTFTVALDEVVIGTGISTGPQPICFDGLDPAEYTVAQSVPSTLEMTTGASAAVFVDAGQTVEVKFGSRPVADDEISSNETPASDTVTPEDDLVADADDATDAGGASPGWLAYVGLGALFVAIAMLGVLIYLLLRQRST